MGFKFFLVTRKKYEGALKNAKLINDERKKVAESNRELQAEILKLKEEKAVLENQIREINHNDISRFKVKNCPKCKNAFITLKNEKGAVYCKECKTKNNKKGNVKNGRRK